MCGIAGIVGVSEPAVRAALEQMNGCMVHRGPDDRGVELVSVNDSWVGLAQRRLSIIDLSAAGHQPMVNPETGDLLIYNGELYSFQRLRKRLEADGVRFVGHSDTEVILHALRRYGPTCISEMEGMYAFAFLDRLAGKLILARDPMGIKPLYTSELPERSGRGLMFASEVRAMLAPGMLDPNIELRGLAGLLAHGAVPEPLTFFRGLRMFPAGCYQVFQIGRSGQVRPEAVRPHWTFAPPDPAVQPAEAVMSVRSALDAAVKDHLIADVPVGVFLSSGLDSTIVAALAAKHSPRIRAFTVGFADAPDMSEAPLAAETARLFGMEFRDIQITGGSALGMMEQWLRSMDQPSADGLNTYVVSKAVRDEGIIVALSGLGGDELFGGYSSFSDVPRIRRAMARMAWLPPGVRAWVMSMSGFGRPGQVREKLADMGRTGANLTGLYVHRRRMMSNRRVAALGLDWRSLGMTDTYLTQDGLASAAIDADLERADPVAAVSRLESVLYMRSTLLRDSDTNGMAHSLEIRVPMLDKRVLDLVHRIPGGVRLPDGVANKHLLRTAFADYLRPDLLKQGKRGFTLPVRRWMSGPLRPYCEEAVKVVERSGLVNPGEVRSIWNGFIANPEMQVWSSALMMVVLGSYLRQLRERHFAPIPNGD